MLASLAHGLQRLEPALLAAAIGRKFSYFEVRGNLINVPSRPAHGERLSCQVRVGATLLHEEVCPCCSALFQNLAGVFPVERGGVCS